MTVANPQTFSGLARCRHCGRRSQHNDVQRGASLRCPNCTESFRVDGRSFAKHDRSSKPIGSTRIADHRGTPRREIKVQHSRDRSGWALYARWWWLKNKGPIPPGHRVFHVDGNSLNDDPSNLALGRFADGIHAKAMENPEWWTKHVHKLRAGCVEHNKLRGEIKRARSWNPSQWYPVDLAKRLIINAPAKKATRVYAAFGCNVPATKRRSAALGWIDASCLGACIMACLIDAPGRSMKSDRLRVAVDAFRVLRGWQPIKCGWHSAMTDLRKRGYLSVQRRGKRVGIATMTQAAVDVRTTPMAVIIVHGSRLNTEPFKHFTKVNADGSPIGRRVTDGRRLLEALHGGMSQDEVLRATDGGGIRTIEELVAANMKSRVDRSAA